MLLVFVFAVATVSAQFPQAVVRLLECAAVVGVLAAVVTLYMQFQESGFEFEYRAFRLSDSGIPGFAEFGNPIISGMHLAFAALTVLCSFLRSRDWSLRLLWALLLLPLGLYLFLTFSRSAWLALIFGGVLLLFLLGNWRIWVLSAAAAFFAVALMALRFPSMFGVESERGVTQREYIWQSVLEAMHGHWFQGHGAGVSMTHMRLPDGQVVVNTHSLYLEVLYQYGIPGLILFVSMLLVAARRLLRVQGSLAIFALSLLTASAAVMFFELHSFIHSPNLVWLWIWLPLGIALGVRGESKCASQ